MADWDERYRRGEHASTAPNHLLVRAVENLAHGRALDLACGAGRHALFLAGLGWQVLAIDASRIGIEITRKRAAQMGVDVDARVADLERREFEIEPKAYDLICDFYYLQRDLWPEIRAGLRRGGLIIAAIHLTSGDGETGNPDFLLQPGELRAEFEGWEILHYLETELEDKDAGQHHRRTAELLARKP